MGKRLVIAEKPSVAQDLSRALPGKFESHDGYYEGEEYILAWAVGHLLELNEPEDYDPVYKQWMLENLPVIPEQFERKARKGQTKLLRSLKRLAKRDDVEGLVNACDAAREGELIYREIEAYLGVDKPAFRLWLQSMTPASIRSAFEELRPTTEFDGLKSAAYCRAEADWLIGMNATRGITRRLKGRRERGVWSAGRVQTPTLALLVRREWEILRHVPQPFWRVRGSFSAAGHEYEALWRESKKKDSDRLATADAAAKVLADCEGRSTSVVEAHTESTRKPPPLYSLTSLQKEANNRFGFSAKRTLAAAQRLYEQHKVLTYPRTDSVALPTDYRAHVQTAVEWLANHEAASMFGVDERAVGITETAQAVLARGLLNTKRNFDNNKVSDHFAIIPTGTPPGTALGGDDARIFELVLRRFLAAFMEESRWAKVERTTTVVSADGTEHKFYCDSRRLVYPGWQGVDKRPKKGEQLPPLGVEAGESVDGEIGEILSEEDATKPRPRLTEAGLLKQMENAGKDGHELHDELEDDELVDSLKEKGLGTPATRADTIEALVNKSYVLRTGKNLRPSAKGITLIDFLARIGASDLSEPTMTAEMEYHLLQVELGERQGSDYIDEVSESVRNLVEKLKTFDYGELYKEEEALGNCLKCGQELAEGLRGYRCPTEPLEDCGFTIWKEFRGRFLGRRIAKLLLEEKDTGPVDGFVNMRGQVYGGRITFDDDLKMAFEAVRGMNEDDGGVEPELISYEVDPEPLGPCLKCGEGSIVETATHFVCKKGKEDGCGLATPRTICKREMTRAEMAAYFDEAALTGWFEDFISRKGRPFTARLQRKPNGRHGFEFKPRQAKKKVAKKKATKKKVTKKKVTKKKVTKKKATKK